MEWDVILEGFSNMFLAMAVCSGLIVFGYYMGSNSKKKINYGNTNKERHPQEVGESSR